MPQKKESRGAKESMFMPAFTPVQVGGENTADYSETSNGGPTEIGTKYNRPLYKGNRLWTQILFSI